MSSGLPSLQQQLDEVNRQQGKEPIPAGNISPFLTGPPPPPLPEFPLPTIDPDLPDDWLDPDMPGDRATMHARGLPMPDSPLIPKLPAEPQPTTGPNSAIGALLEQGLVVIGRLGAWKGREVQLSEAEEKKIRGVVLLAIRKELDADLEQVAQKRPRRPRIAQAAVPAPTTAPKRRGRPRGSLLARTQP